MTGCHSRFLLCKAMSAAVALAVLTPAALLASPQPGPTPLSQLSAAGVCVSSVSALCLNNERFKIEVQWRDFQGNTGAGQAVPLTGDTGYFWFFSSTNVELVIKVLDARTINGHFWVFYGALSNVEYGISVTDTVTGSLKTYYNPPQQFASVGDTQAFPTSAGSSAPPGIGASAEFGGLSEFGPSPDAIAPGLSAQAQTISCVPDATALCLAGDRFRVEVNWRDFQGRAGRGQAAPRLTADTGYFWFFNSANVELVVKVLDARVINGRFWVFYGALSNVEYEIIVVDTATGSSKRYRNPANRFASAGDTQAFPLDPGIPTPVATAVGTPNGLLATRSIGPAGGSLTSQDGRLTLTIPPNALASTVAFTIQPITNQAPGGLGNAYRLEPSGQTFTTPVEISFQYDLQDLSGTVAEALGVAYQDAQRFWRVFKSVALDQINKTLTVSTTHLSDWSRLSGFQLTPSAARVPVGRSLGLALVFCKQIDYGEELTSLLAKCAPERGDFTVSGWAVNGSPGGNSTIGTVVQAGDFGATYRTPAAQPTPNVVAVSAQLDGALQKYLVVSNITITIDDSWTGTGSSRAVDDAGGVYSVTAQVTWTLEGTVNNVSTYTPTGTASLVYSACSITPSSGTITNDGGFLIVDYNANPPTYQGGGGAQWVATVRCGTGDPVTGLVGAPFFGGSKGPAGFFAQGLVSPDGLTIEGSDTTTLPDGRPVTFNWKFTRQ